MTGWGLEQKAALGLSHKSNPKIVSYLEGEEEEEEEENIIRPCWLDIWQYKHDKGMGWDTPLPPHSLAAVHALVSGVRGRDDLMTTCNLSVKSLFMLLLLWGWGPEGGLTYVLLHQWSRSSWNCFQYSTCTAKPDQVNA